MSPNCNVHLATLDRQIVSKSLATQDCQITSDNLAIQEGQIASDQIDSCPHDLAMLVMLTSSSLRQGDTCYIQYSTY
jgi:hypothetical protein